MSANTKQTCRHCGMDAVPVGHRCPAKQQAIDNARIQNTFSRRVRPKQKWDGTGWVKL